MNFKNPWGKGSKQHDLWFTNDWEPNDPGKGKHYTWGPYLDVHKQVPSDVPRPLEFISRTPNPAGKNSNPQLIAFDWKTTAEKLNNPMNWEMGSGEWVGEGPEPFEKGPSVTSVTLCSTEFIFTSADAINKWNEQLATVQKKLSVGGGIAVGAATARMTSWVGIAIGAAAGLALDSLLEAIEVKLNPGDKIVVNVKIETVRSTQQYQNKINFTSSMLSVGSNPVVIKTNYSTLDLDPNNIDEDNEVMRVYENSPAMTTRITDPDFKIGRPELTFIRTN